MIANEPHPQMLDSILNEIASSSTTPDAAQLREWIAKYPDFKSEIIDFVTDLIEMEAAARTSIEATQEDVDLVVNRTMSRVQQMLFDEKSTKPLTDLMTEINSSGHDFESFQRTVGIDRSILSCLAAHLITPATIPRRLKELIATTLHRPLASVEEFLQMPPVIAAAYKSKRRPQTTQVDFKTILDDADLPDIEKDRWRREALI